MVGQESVVVVVVVVVSIHELFVRYLDGYIEGTFCD